MAVGSVSVVMGLGAVAVLAVLLAGFATVARLLRERRAPATLRIDGGPLERVYRADRRTLADEVLDGATQVRGTRIVRDREAGVLLLVRGRHLGASPKVDLYVQVELPSDGRRTSYVLTAQAVDPQDGAEADLALRAFESRLRTHIKRSSGLSALAEPGA